MPLFLHKSKKYLMYIGFIGIFLFTLFSATPAWVLGSLVNRVSHERLRLYNTHGTFWHGSGLLVVFSERAHRSSPLLLTNWDISAGLTKFIDIKFKVGNTPIADLYLNKKGANLDNLDLSLSIAQISQLFDIVSSFGLSGNLEIMSSHLLVGKVQTGDVTVKLNSIASSLSPVNPLGTYTMKLDVATTNLSVSSDPASNLLLDGNGDGHSLTLTGRVTPDKKEQMLEFITVMGMPQGDGSYKMKIY